ncbi:MAG: hypothetical protein COV59_00770 [Candidatus Magasanikbacteria bacterium CG11_big_fil_rev_8_21_14_0_20_39_34]|uniref:S-adenosylmethionine decarboxylase n=1 Tax=Candidatus Magasanikbacteria bacterium CG11_big_fil_rev_8_21_14_0_20_39_34 TaxID=1974653 RepID=A0A2H0N8M3_9BACT|nr:MAG: hypothetical protein COV59_00770 [Candidatus Magasanikbacteria bacterium CG11_big_fil_rev_8_21_14_0_20_39_34]
MTWKNLAPKIVRQRVIIEGTTQKIVSPDAIEDYLLQLSKVLDMRALRDPFTYPAEDKGYGGWIHWVTSGAHFYSYSENWSNPSLFTVDAYTCKPFNAEKAVQFTKEYFNPIEIVWKEVEV